MARLLRRREWLAVEESATDQGERHWRNERRHEAVIVCVLLGKVIVCALLGRAIVCALLGRAIVCALLGRVIVCALLGRVIVCALLGMAIVCVCVVAQKHPGVDQAKRGLVLKAREVCGYWCDLAGEGWRVGVVRCGCVWGVRFVRAGAEGRGLRAMRLDRMGRRGCREHLPVVLMCGQEQKAVHWIGLEPRGGICLGRSLCVGSLERKCIEIAVGFFELDGLDAWAALTVALCVFIVAQVFVEVEAQFFKARLFFFA